jgi:hypothetical protein
MRKSFIALGFTVFARGFADGGYFVRIVGGAVDDGRLLRQTSTSPLPYNAYLVSGGKLKEYAASTALSAGNVPRLSFNGQTYVWRTDAPGAVASISRRRRAAQTVSPIVDADQGYARSPNVFDYAGAAPPQVQPAGRPAHAWSSQDGQNVTVLEPRYYPQVLRIGAAQLAQEALDPSLWTGGTSFDVVSTGEPAPLASYKAEKAGHAYRFYAATPSQATGVIWLQTHYDSGVQYYAKLPDGTGAAAPGRHWVDYDYLNDRLLLSLWAPYVSSFVATVGGGKRAMDVYLGYEHVLWQYDYATTTWTEVSRRTVPDMAYTNWDEVAGGTFNRLTTLVETYNGIQVRSETSELIYRLDNDNAPFAQLCDFVTSPAAAPKRFWIVPPVVRASTGTPPTSEGALSLTGAGAAVFVDGVAQSYTLPAPSTAAKTMLVKAWAPGGFLYQVDIAAGLGWHWFDTVALTDAALTLDSGQNPWLSPDGRRVWADAAQSTNSPRYYSQGVLKRTWAPVPAASGTYATPSADGFWFVKEFIGWSTKTPSAAKLAVYTTATAPAPIPVLSGTVYNNGAVLQTFVVNDANGGIAPDLSGIWLWNVDHFQFFSNASLVATYGGPITYSTGAGYNITNPSTWNTATLLLQYDETKDVFKNLHTYGGTIATTEDPGNPATPAITLTGPTLVQDELIPHK